MQQEDGSKIKLRGLVLLIFGSIFGFSNSMTAYYQMGYASIIWYIFGAVFFFLPSALMFAEYGATFKDAAGGIFSWLRGSIGEKPAFIGTFIWLAAWVVWLVSSTQYFLVCVSNMLFGSDQTQNWHFAGLAANEVLGLLEVAFIIIVTLIATCGVDKIKRIGSIGGMCVLSITIGFAVLSVILLLLRHGQMAQSLNTTTLTHSPNPSFQTPLTVMSFVVYALFAYGGLETSSGMIDSVDRPEKTYPKAIAVAMVVMTVAYVCAIILCGVSANWHTTLGKSGVDLANVEYVLINNLGVQIGTTLGLSHATSVTIGTVFAHLAGLSDVLSGLGAAFVMTYSPIKSFVLGCDPELLPARLRKLNAHQMPAFAMWLQAIIVAAIILAIAFGGQTASNFYTVLTNMMNVSSSAPYLFLIGAFPFFKRKKDLQRPFVFYRKPWVIWTVTTIVWLVVALGILFTIIAAALEGEWKTAFWTAFGPVFFGLIAWLFYTWKERRQVNQR